MKYYIAIRAGRVVAHWGGEIPPLSESQLAETWGGSASEIREIAPPAHSVPIGLNLACYTADWRRKSARQLTAEKLDECGTPLPTAAQIAAKAEREAKITKLKTKIKKLKRWIAFDFERQQLVPVAEKLADNVWNKTDLLAKQRKAHRAAKDSALKNLKTAHAKLIQKSAENRTKYTARLAQAVAELAKLEKQNA